ncbi:MAG: nucleotidyltransferase domain-containing protein [Candidatus Kerfeldbacteria bacterium]|nr:nucleotidyltransferase domain-containing protein [Candidatus Kerfeldbacteria bacterium]
MPLTFNTIKKSIVPILKNSDINYAGLFGSYARNESKADSDVDLLVTFSKPVSLLTVCRVERTLSEVLKKLD